MERAQGFAQQGARLVWTAGHSSTTLVQETGPFAIITVYLTGTTTLAAIYSDNQTPPTPLANPFTANENGYWFFYAQDGRYDVMIECPDWTWTIGDLLLGDPGSWSADQNANGHWLRGLGGISFSNPNCPAGASIWLNDNCHIQMSACLDVPCLDVSGSAAIHGSLEVFGNASVFGYLQTPCVQYTAGGPGMWLCADSSGTLHIRDQFGNDVASMNQGGLFNAYKIVAQQIEATQSLASLGNLWVSGNAYVSGYVSTPCVQYIAGGPAMWLCADSSGTLHIRDTNNNDVGSINQGGLFDIFKLVAQQIEGVQSIWSLGSLGSDGGILTHGAIYADGGLNGAYLDVSGCIYIQHQQVFCLGQDKHVGTVVSMPCIGLTGVSLYLGCSYDARVGQSTGIFQLYAPLDDDPPLAAIPSECMMIVCGNTTGITTAGPEFVSLIVRDQFGALYSGRVPLVPGYNPTLPMGGGVVTSVNGMTGDVTVQSGVSSVNGMTGAVTIPAGVTSVNGQTGAVTVGGPPTWQSWIPVLYDSPTKNIIPISESIGAYSIFGSWVMFNYHYVLAAAKTFTTYTSLPFNVDPGGGGWGQAVSVSVGGATGVEHAYTNVVTGLGSVVTHEGGGSVGFTIRVAGVVKLA